jgi:hypothetical protein
VKHGSRQTLLMMMHLTLRRKMSMGSLDFTAGFFFRRETEKFLKLSLSSLQLAVDILSKMLLTSQ